MRVRRTILVGVVLIAVLAIAAVATYEFAFDWAGRPFCHKQIMTGFMVWMKDSGWDINIRTNSYPNVGGRSRDSLFAISSEMNGQMAWADHYRYVPGLREDDPGDLVLMYMDAPTRWTWHGPAPLAWEDKAWIVVPLDFTLGTRVRRGPGELSERISSTEFRSRLERTITFVRTNQRPNWQVVVTEHGKFLETLDHAPN